MSLTAIKDPLQYEMVSLPMIEGEAPEEMMLLGNRRISDAKGSCFFYAAKISLLAFSVLAFFALAMGTSRASTSTLRKVSVVFPCEQRLQALVKEECNRIFTLNLCSQENGCNKKSLSGDWEYAQGDIDSTPSCSLPSDAEGLQGDLVTVCRNVEKGDYSPDEMKCLYKRAPGFMKPLTAHVEETGIMAQSCAMMRV